MYVLVEVFVIVLAAANTHLRGLKRAVKVQACLIFGPKSCAYCARGDALHHKQL